MRIIKENAVAVIIDVQERLMPVINDNDQLLARLQMLIQGLNALEVETIVTEQYTKGLGFTVDSIKDNLKAYSPLEKICFSCHEDEGFKNKLYSTEKNHVIIAGIEAHVCVQQTVLDLIDDGFIPVVVEDCVSSRTLHNKQIAIERMRAAGAIITTYESILLELCRAAGTDTFKTISKLIK